MHWAWVRQACHRGRSAPPDGFRPNRPRRSLQPDLGRIARAILSRGFSETCGDAPTSVGLSGDSEAASQQKQYKARSLTLAASPQTPISACCLNTEPCDCRRPGFWNGCRCAVGKFCLAIRCSGGWLHCRNCAAGTPMRYFFTPGDGDVAGPEACWDDALLPRCAFAPPYPPTGIMAGARRTPQALMPSPWRTPSAVLSTGRLLGRIVSLEAIRMRSRSRSQRDSEEHQRHCLCEWGHLLPPIEYVSWPMQCLCLS